MSQNINQRDKSNEGWHIRLYQNNTENDQVFGIFFIENQVKSAKIQVIFSRDVMIGGHKKRKLSDANILHLTRHWYKGVPRFRCTEIGPNQSFDDVRRYEYLYGGWSRYGGAYEIVVVLRNKYYLLEVNGRLIEFLNVEFSTPSGPVIYRVGQRRGVKKSSIVSLFWGTMYRCKVDKYSIKQGWSGCAITTAVLANDLSIYSDDLTVLRSYRRGWLDRFALGRHLSSWYDRWSPPVAQWLTNNPRVSVFLLNVFIHPCARALELTAASNIVVRTIVRVCVMFWYIVASCTAMTLYKLQKLLI